MDCGAGFETFTGDGPISYWNTYVGVSQMGGQGNFSDSRINLSIAQNPDLVTSKLPELLQVLSLAPPAPAGSFNVAAAERGSASLPERPAAPRATSRRPSPTSRAGPIQTPVRHDPNEVGTDPRYAARSATKRYRTSPLRGIWQHPPIFTTARPPP